MAILLNLVKKSFLPSTYAGHVNLAPAKHWQFVPSWKGGSSVELVIFGV